MDLIVEELKESNLEDLGKVDGSFVIDSQLVLQVEADQIRYTIVDLPVKEKHYTQEERDHSAFIDNPHKAVFVATLNGIIAGWIVLSEHWNNLAYIDYVAVDVEFRRHGVGRALIDRAKQWAGQKGFPGIMLETQTNNVRACKFYERCGFRLGGFDKLLYQGQDNDTDEVAIFYYFFFDD